jgi:hypothetical protein
MNNLLVTLADRNFIAQAKQLFSSAYWNGGWRGDYLLLAHGDISDEELSWFRSKNIIVFRCEPLGKSAIGRKNHPAVVLSKFYLFTSFFKKWRKIVFLDADIIVRASLERMVANGGFLAPNATGVNLKKEFSKKRNPEIFRELRRNYPLRGCSFNTGVFAFDGADIKDDTFQKILGLYGKFGALNSYGEEGTFNLFFRRKWKMLPIVYNAYPQYMDDSYGIKSEHLRAVILHFVESEKPWNRESPFHAEWERNFKNAERIDLNARREPAARWTPEDEKGFARSLILPGFFISLAYHTRPFSTLLFRIAWKTKFLLLSIDRMIGKVGLIIKKKSPRLYERIRIKNE